jgi:hypothetical protein
LKGDRRASKAAARSAETRGQESHRAAEVNREAPTDGMTFEINDLYNLPWLGVGPFDVTFFNGILYHLPDPIHPVKLGLGRIEILAARDESFFAAYDRQENGNRTTRV